jgi:hypothetical protein
MADKEPPHTPGADTSSTGTPSGPAGMWPGPRNTAPIGGQVETPRLTDENPELERMRAEIMRLEERLAAATAAHRQEPLSLKGLDIAPTSPEGLNNELLSTAARNPIPSLSVQADSDNRGRERAAAAPPILGRTIENPIPMVSNVRESFSSGNPRSQFATLRPESPKTFTGKTSELEDWLDSVEIYLALYGLGDDRIQYMVVLQFMSPDVKNWVKTLEIASWTRLQRSMLEYYADPLEEERAWSSLNKLQQTASVKDYTEKFLQLVVKIGKSVSKEDRLRRYVEGLKDEVRITIRIGMIEGRYTTFNQMKSAAEALDYELWRNRSRATTERTHARGNASKGPSGNHGGASSSGTNNHNNPRRFPSKVNSLQKSYSLSKEETAKRLEKNLCFRCGKPGHIARDCPDKEETEAKHYQKK